MGGGGKVPKNQTQTTKVEPWAGAQPYIKDYLARGKEVTNDPYSYYNGDRIAGFSPEQQMGMQQQTQRALAGSKGLNAANKLTTSTINGDYLNPESNPYLKANVNQALGDVQTRVNSQFNNSNFGSSAHQESLTRDLGNTANAMYGDNYARERGMQAQASQFAPQLAQADYMDGDVLQGIGAQRQGLSQRYLDQATGDYNGAANFQYDQLNRYGDVVRAGQGVGSNSSTTGPGQQQPRSNPYASALGLASTGLGLYNGLGAAGLIGGGGALSSVIGAGGFGALAL